MEDLKNNKMFWVLLGVTVFNIGAFLVGKVVIDKAADRVIQKLQKDYSPSPYGPGFDPDKVSPDGFKTSKRYFELRTQGDPERILHQENAVQSHGGIVQMVQEAGIWREDWEKDRGFTPAQ